MPRTAHPVNFFMVSRNSLKFGAFWPVAKISAKPLSTGEELFLRLRKILHSVLSDVEKCKRTVKQKKDLSKKTRVKKVAKSGSKSAAAVKRDVSPSFHAL